MLNTNLKNLNKNISRCRLPSEILSLFCFAATNADFSWAKFSLYITVASSKLSRHSWATPSAGFASHACRYRLATSDCPDKRGSRRFNDRSKLSEDKDEADDNDDVDAVNDDQADESKSLLVGRYDLYEIGCGGDKLPASLEQVPVVSNCRRFRLKYFCTFFLFSFS